MVDVDAHQFSRFRILRAGTHGHADARFVDEQGEGDQKHDRRDDDKHLCHGNVEAHDFDAFAFKNGRKLSSFAAHQEEERVLQHDGCADGADQHREFRLLPLAKRAKGQPFIAHADQAREHDAQQEAQPERQLGDGNQNIEQIRADHVDRAMREVD